MNRIIPIVALAIVAGCKGDGEGLDLNIFSIDDDIMLGMQIRDEILADQEAYPVVDEADAPEAYGHLRRIRDQVLASGEVQYDDRFAYEVYLVKDDEVLNAFAAPGGYLFFYTGLIRYLETEDHFAGVMGHEIGHAAERHSTDQLTQQYGLSTLLEIALGEEASQGTIATIATNIAGLSFSRSDETEADALSVQYLCDGPNAADGAAGFFAKLQEEGVGSGPEFLSTHPSPDNRVEEIRNLAVELDCNLDPDPNGMWDAFQASLP